MQTNNLKYLKFVRFKEVEQWDVKRFLPNCNIQFQNSIKLKDILFPCFENVSKDEMLKNNWSIISKINFGGNLFLRDVEEARTFKGNLNKITGDTVIYSKINVRHGCIYYHPIGATPFGVSSEYPSYKFDPQKVYGHFLVMVIRSSYFKNILNKKTTGISKARVKSDEFLNVKIPLPTLTEQESLVSAYNSKIAEAEAKETEAGRKSTEIEEYLLYELGIQKDEPNSNKTEESEGYLRFVRFKDVDRWDCYNDSECKVKSKYSNVPLSKIIIGKPMYGAAYKAVKKISNIRYIRITDINEDGSLNNDFVTVDKYENQYLLKQDDFLIARTGNTVGKTFLYDKKYGDAIFAGYLIKFVLNQKMVNPHFLLLYTKSSLFKEWINGNMRVSAQPNINSQQYSNCPIVLPPLEIQNTIVAHISEQKEQVKQLKQEAKELRERALKDFENEIFG